MENHEDMVKKTGLHFFVERLGRSRGENALAIHEHPEPVGEKINRTHFYRVTIPKRGHRQILNARAKPGPVSGLQNTVLNSHRFIFETAYSHLDDTWSWTPSWYGRGI